MLGGWHAPGCFYGERYGLNISGLSGSRVKPGMAIMGIEKEIATNIWYY